MIKKYSSIFVLFCLVAKTLFADASNDTYWVSFVLGFHAPKYLLKIDALGEILTDPVRLSDLNTGTFNNTGTNLPDATALSGRSKDQLNIWLYTRDQKIARAVVNKKSSEVSKIQQTEILSSDSVHLQVASRIDFHFIVYSVDSGGTEYLVGREMTPAGLPLNNVWKLSSQPTGGAFCDLWDCGGGISSDGRMAFFAERNTSKNNLFVQPLGKLGRPSGKTVLIESMLKSSRHLYSVDVSNTIENSWRALVYTVDPGTFTDGHFQIFLQKIDARTGQKQGERILISRTKDTLGQDVAIDPQGRFIIYSNEALLFQALDATGHASGKPKILYNKKSVAGGIDIFKDE